MKEGVGEECPRVSAGVHNGHGNVHRLNAYSLANLQSIRSAGCWNIRGWLSSFLEL